MPIALPKRGDGFTLRPFALEDAVPLAEVEFDIEVKRFLALPKNDKARWIETFDPATYGGWVAWAVDVGGVLAGRASLHRAKRRGDCELVIVIARSFWGLRLGRKLAAALIHAAFEEFDAKALVAEVHPDNRASIALLRAFKFRRRGIVNAPPEHWQRGHLVYRLSRGSYNKSLDTEKQLQAAASPLGLFSGQLRR